MKYEFLFGLKIYDVESLYKELVICLDVMFKVRESWYLGGGYYVLSMEMGENVIIQNNVECDDELVEEIFLDFLFLIQVLGMNDFDVWKDCIVNQFVIGEFLC